MPTSAVGIVDVTGSFADQVRRDRVIVSRRFRSSQRQRWRLRRTWRAGLLGLSGMLGGQVVALAAVQRDGVQFPAVSVEIRPAGGRGRVNGVGEPAFMPDPTRSAQHELELGGLAGVGGRVGKAAINSHRPSFAESLTVPGSVMPNRCVDGGRDVATLAEIVLDFTVCSNAVGQR